MRATADRFPMLLLFAACCANAQEAASPDEAAAARAAEIDALEPAVGRQEAAGSRTAPESREEAPRAEALVADDIRRRVAGNGVMDELDLGRTEVTGNQELPKVLYIVPWQKSDPGQLTGKPINTLLDEVLAPLDRSEFMRQVDYYDDLYRDGEQ